LKTASRGTISNLDLMAASSTLLAGAQGNVATEMANALPRLLEIAKAAEKANPALGNTSFLFQSLATGIKRSQPLIIDNTGLTLKLGEANEKYAAKLGKTVEQMTAGEKQIALLNATLEAGNVLIQQVGGTTESVVDPFTRLDATVENISNRLKTKFAPSLATAATALELIMTWDERVDAAMQEHLDTVIKTAGSYQEYEAELRRSAGVTGQVVMTQEQYNRAMEQGGFAAGYARNAVILLTEEELRADRIREQTRGGIVKTRGALSEMGDAAGAAAEELGNANIELVKLDKARLGQEAVEQLNAAFDAGLIDIDEYRFLMVEVGGKFLELPADQLTASLALADLKQDFQEGELTAREYYNRIVDIGVELGLLPDRVDVDIYLNTHGSIPSVPGLPRVPGAPIPRQSGGPVEPGRVYQLHGPELFVSNFPGQIIPNSQLGAAGGGGMVNNFYNYNYNSQAAAMNWAQIMTLRGQRLDRSMS